MNLHQFFQLFVNGTINGSRYALLGVSFALIISVTGRFHLAYVLSYTLAAYAASSTADAWGFPFPLAALAGIIVAIAVGVAIEVVVYRPIARKAGGSALLTIFVAALGLTIAAENAIRLTWGSASENLSGLPRNGLSIGDVTFTALDVISLIVFWVLIVGLTLFLQRTRQGRLITAVRVNPEMARVVGIDPDRIYLLVFAIGSALGGVAAILFTVKYAAVPDMGLDAVFKGFLVAFLAGTASSPTRIAGAAVLLGLVESLSGLWLKAQWSPLVVFSVLFIYLTLLPLDFWRPRRLVSAFAR